jgi:hypothetical protein
MIWKQCPSGQKMLCRCVPKPWAKVPSKCQADSPVPWVFERLTSEVEVNLALLHTPMKNSVYAKKMKKDRDDAEAALAAVAAVDQDVEDAALVVEERLAKKRKGAVKAKVKPSAALSGAPETWSTTITTLDGKHGRPVSVLDTYMLFMRHQLATIKDANYTAWNQCMGFSNIQFYSICFMKSVALNGKNYKVYSGYAFEAKKIVFATAASMGLAGPSVSLPGSGSFEDNAVQQQKELAARLLAIVQKPVMESVGDASTNTPEERIDEILNDADTSWQTDLRKFVSEVVPLPLRAQDSTSRTLRSMIDKNAASGLAGRSMTNLLRMIFDSICESAPAKWFALAADVNLGTILRHDVFL